MTKTGSTSIQATLYYEKLGPGFVYCGFGEINGSYALDALVGRSSYISALRGTALGRGVNGYRRQVERRFQRSISQARERGADLLLSAEFCFFWDEHQHLAFRELASRQGLQVRVLVYVRPTLDWLSASLSENLKFGRFVDHEQLKQIYSGNKLPSRLRTIEHLENLRKVYGAEHVIVRPFLRHQLAEGCVVHDVCQVIGMAHPPARIHHRNVRISLPTSQCLHLHNLARGRPLQGPLDLLRRDAVIRRLERIFGDTPGLRLHSSVLGEHEAHARQQLDILRERFGLDLPLSAEASTAGALESLDELLLPTEQTRRQLAEAVSAPAGAAPEQAMARLDRGLGGQQLLKTGHRILRREWRHVLTGC